MNKLLVNNDLFRFKYWTGTSFSTLKTVVPYFFFLINASSVYFKVVLMDPGRIYERTAIFCYVFITQPSRPRGAFLHVCDRSKSLENHWCPVASRHVVFCLGPGLSVIWYSHGVKQWMRSVERLETSLLLENPRSHESLWNTKSEC